MQCWWQISVLAVDGQCLHSVKTFCFLLSLCLHAWGWAKAWEGTQPVQLTPTDQDDILCHFIAIKLDGLSKEIEVGCYVETCWSQSACKLIFESFSVGFLLVVDFWFGWLMGFSFTQWTLYFDPHVCAFFHPFSSLPCSTGVGKE